MGIELAMLLGEIMEPIGDCWADAGWPGAGNNGVQTGGHGISPCALVTKGKWHYLCDWR